MTPVEHARKLAELQAEAYTAMFDVHVITGRTDQSVRDICQLHPEHPVVLKHLDVQRRLNEFLGEDE